MLYTRWQAGGSVRLDADGVFQEISRLFNESADFSEAFSRMLSAGFTDKGLEVAGLDELLERLDDALCELQVEGEVLDEPAGIRDMPAHVAS